MSFAQEYNVLTENIVMLKAPILQPNQAITYFNKDSDVLIYGKVLKTSSQEGKYEIECCWKGKTSKVVVEFDSLRILPVFFFKNFEYFNLGDEHRYRTFIEQENELLSYDHPLVNLNQLEEKEMLLEAI